MGRPRKHNKQLPERLYFRPPSYYFVDYVTDKWVNLGRDYVKAMAEYASRTANDQPCITVGDMIDRYLREIASLKAPRTYSDNLIEAKGLRRVFGQVPLTDVTTQDVYKYLDGRGKKARVRANREITLLTSMFKKAERWGDISHSDNPCVGIEKHKEVARKRYITDLEFVAFKKHAGPFIAAYMDVKYLTGLRQADLLKLRLSDLKEDGIHVIIGKSGKQLIIEWNDTLRAAIKTARKLTRPVRGLFVFSNRRGQQYTGSGFRSIWQRRMRSALADGILDERFTEHDIRAKTASDTERGHATELLAHADARTTDRIYRRKPQTVLPMTKVLEE